MRRDDRDDPFDDIFREIERMMNEMASGGTRTNDTGFGADPHLDVHESTDTVRVVGDFPGVENDPDEGTLDPPCVWEGLPFRHGERWSMPVTGGPEWRIKMTQSFQFPSTYDHTGLARTYRSFRPNGGRFRINEHGHVWMELPNERVQRSEQLTEKLEAWYADANDDIWLVPAIALQRSIDDTSTESPRCESPNRAHLECRECDRDTAHRFSEFEDVPDDEW